MRVVTVRQGRQGLLQRPDVDLAHQAPDVLVLTGQCRPALEAARLQNSLDQRFGQRQGAELFVAHADQMFAQFLQAVGLPFAQAFTGR